jgi:hypothetical protein
MPKDVADWTTAVGAPWVAVGGKTTAGAGPDSFDTTPSPPEAQTLGIVVEGGVLNTIGPIHVVGKTTGTAYQVNFAGQQTGMVVVRIRPDLDLQYTVSWSTASGAGVVVSAATSPLDFTYPALGQQGMAASIPVVIASDQTPLLINVGAGLDVDANIDEVGGAAISLGPKGKATSFPVVPPTDLPIGGASQQAMVASLPVVIASDQSDLPVKTGAGGDLGVNVDKYGGTATTLGQKVAASSLPVVIASDQSAIPISAIGGLDVDANLDEIGGVGFSIGQHIKSASISVALAAEQFPQQAVSLLQNGVGTTVMVAGVAGQIVYVWGMMWEVFTGAAGASAQLQDTNGVIRSSISAVTAGNWPDELDGAAGGTVGTGVQIVVVGGAAVVRLSLRYSQF